MPANTHVALDKVTVNTATNEITFTSIPQGYTDLFISSSYKLNADDLPLIVVGTGGTIDTGTNYSYTFLRGTGTTASTGRASNAARIFVSYSDQGWANFQVNIMNYSNSTTFKTILSRGNDATNNGTLSYAGLWRNTGAINTVSLRVGGSNFQIGSTFSLYGIKSWAEETTPKATGGLVTSDATYWYHTFTNSSTFTPNQTLTCDYLIVGGGGGGGPFIGGGGGAGGYRPFSSASISAGSYPVVIGAGGSGGWYGGISGSLKTAGTAGSSSSFNSYTAAGGGRGAYFADGSFFGPATSGGSGGGGSRNQSAGSGNTPSTSPVQGYAGGNGKEAPEYNAGGGGGAGGAGSNSSTNSGSGGPGLNWQSLGTYYAGGGGGAPGDQGGAGAGGIGGGGNGVAGKGQAGTAGTGGGGGGGQASGGEGGGGVVIIRYAKA